MAPRKGQAIDYPKGYAPRDRDGHGGRDVFRTQPALGTEDPPGARRGAIAAAIGVTLHDVILPVIPLLLRWEYDFGYWLLSNPHALPPRLRLMHARPSVWLHWSTFLTVGRPLLVGSFILAIPVSIVTYYVTLFVMKRRKRKRISSPGANGRTAKDI
jgi:uncharacterized protein